MGYFLGWFDYNCKLTVEGVIADCLDGIDAIKVFGYECIYHGERVNIPYPKGPEGKAPEGRSFHHGKFIMKLREAARRTPKYVVSWRELGKGSLRGNIC